MEAPPMMVVADDVDGWSASYVVAVANDWELWLGRDWERLSGAPSISLDVVQDALDALDELDARPASYDAVPVPEAGHASVRVLREQLSAIRAEVERSYVAPGDLGVRAFVTSPRPRLWSLHVLLEDVSRSEVMCLVATDQAAQPTSGWHQRAAIASLPELRYLALSGNHLGAVELAVDLLQLPRLDALDLSGNELRAIPSAVLDSPSLRWLDLHHNQVSFGAALDLGRCGTLRYVNLRSNPIDQGALPLLTSALPAGCVIDLDE